MSERQDLKRDLREHRRDTVAHFCYPGTTSATRMSRPIVGALVGLLQQYSAVQRRSPMASNFVTGGTLMVVGDSAVQVVAEQKKSIDKRRLAVGALTVCP